MNYKEMSDQQIEFAVSDALGIPRGDRWCSSWADAGPISHEHGMTTIKLQDGMWVVISEFIDENSRRFSYTDKNILRAICIVFLMMRGGE